MVSKIGGSSNGRTVAFEAINWGSIPCPPATMDNTEKIYLTQLAISRLQTQLANLKKSLPHFINETQRTAAYGDRSENAEYKEAKSNLRRTNNQIRSIENQLKRAVPIKLDQNKKGVVQLGSTVVLESQEGTKKTFQILGPQETNPSKGIISYQSPLGTALLNRKKGETITIKTANGIWEYRILEIT